MNDALLVKGGHPVRGRVRAYGSKNAVTKLMVASLLTREKCVIENIPLLADVDITKELCESVGSKIELNPEKRRLELSTEEVTNPLVSRLSRRNRIPILALGPLLHRRGFVEVPVLGGCPIGHRPINFHVEALSQMGVRIERRKDSYYAEADKIRGTEIDLPFPSVGATENILLTAVLASGTTLIRNAAVEPEILSLVDVLNNMGARVSYDPGARIFEIKGVSSLKGTSVRVMPDRNEVVSLAVAALATGGEVFIENIEESYLVSFLAKIKEVGGAYEIAAGGIKFYRGDSLRGVLVETSPHPGFMTDWLQPFSVLLTQADGESLLHETVFEDRFGYIRDLKRMGAQIDLSQECWGSGPCRFFSQGHHHSARVRGATHLQGAAIKMQDIRAGMAHLIAALVARGESTLTGVEHLDRGYEKIDERLCALGADIRRVKS